MCPECIANAAMMAGGILSTGGAAAIGARVFGRAIKGAGFRHLDSETQASQGFDRNGPQNSLADLMSGDVGDAASNY
jgi:hypothetical protein